MNKLVESARKYLGVRFRHRGRNSRGLDCAGLVWVAYRDAGVILPDFRLYGREPSSDGLVRHATEALGTPVATAPVSPKFLKAGDVIVVRFVIEPHHLAIVGDYHLGGLKLIHACGHVGRVLECRLEDDYVKKVTHVFRRPV